VDRPRREPLGVEPQVADDVPGQAHGVGLVVDRELAGEAELVGVAPQDADAGRVERRHPHLLRDRADERLDPGLHLVGGLVGEGDGQDLERADAPVADQVGDAMGQHPGLARPGAGHHEQRPLVVRDGVGLHGVEPGEHPGRRDRRAVGPDLGVGGQVDGAGRAGRARVGRGHGPTHARAAL
jgi:hypothetical protein